MNERQLLPDHCEAISGGLVGEALMHPCALILIRNAISSHPLINTLHQLVEYPLTRLLSHLLI